MALLESYGLWNNKGGVGKSTITYHLATRYAEQHPGRNVLVIDMCPQANASMMLLGGGVAGENQVLSYCTQATPHTVVGYLSQVIAGGAGAPLPNPMSFLVQVSTINTNMPGNMFLLCGDGNLEPMAPAISAAANAPPLTPSAQPWVWVHRVMRGLIDNVVATQASRDWIIFVDTNPSFGIYTELAVSAVNRLLVPVNADDSSRIAANAMFLLLHGTTPPHPIYGSWTYASRAIQYNMAVPRIHLIIGNRLTQYGGAAAAFRALSDATADALYTAYTTHPNYFTPRTTPIPDVSVFRDHYSRPLRDFNTAGVVAAHLGRRLSRMSQGYYQVHGDQVKVNAGPLADCLGAIDSVINSL